MILLNTRLLLSWLSFVALLSLFSCEKEQVVTSSEEESPVVNFRSEPDFLYAVTEYDPMTGQQSVIYEIERSSRLPTGFQTNVYFNGMVVTDVIGITRMEDIHFNNGVPFYAVTLGPNSNVPQNPSVVFGITDIRSGEIMFEVNDNDTSAGMGTHVKDIEWSDWGGFGLIGIENQPTLGVHYLVDFLTPHQVDRYEILNVPPTEEVRGLSWVYYQNTSSFNCTTPPAQPLHHFDALDVTQGGTLPIPPSGLHTLYLSTLDAGGNAHLYSLVFDRSTLSINAYFVQVLLPGAGFQHPNSELALGWDYDNHNMYMAGNAQEAYNFGLLSSCPAAPLDLMNITGKSWNASVADFTSQPFGF